MHRRLHLNYRQLPVDRQPQCHQMQWKARRKDLGMRLKRFGLDVLKQCLQVNKTVIPFEGLKLDFTLMHLPACNRRRRKEVRNGDHMLIR